MPNEPMEDFLDAVDEAIVKLHETHGVWLERIGIACPVQLEGELDGLHLYFRARGRGWQFEVSASKEAEETLWTNNFIKPDPILAAIEAEPESEDRQKRWGERFLAASREPGAYEFSWFCGEPLYKALAESVDAFRTWRSEDAKGLADRKRHMEQVIARRIEDEAKRLSKFLALPATPYSGDPVGEWGADEMLFDEDEVCRRLAEFFAEHPESVPLFAGSRRVRLAEPPDLLEYWNENWEYEQELDRDHVPQSVWDAAEALNKAIAEAEVDFWEVRYDIRIEFSEALIARAKEEAAALRKEDEDDA